MGPHGFCLLGVKREAGLSIRGAEELSRVNAGFLLGLGTFQWRGINSYFEHVIF